MSSTFLEAHKQDVLQPYLLEINGNKQKINNIASNDQHSAIYYQAMKIFVNIGIAFNQVAKTVLQLAVGLVCWLSIIAVGVSILMVASKFFTFSESVQEGILAGVTILGIALYVKLTDSIEVFCDKMAGDLSRCRETVNKVIPLKKKIAASYNAGQKIWEKTRNDRANLMRLNIKALDPNETDLLWRALPGEIKDYIGQFVLNTNLIA